MPFDVVFLNTFEASKPLAMKNLIGRAGRSTTDPKYDFGIVVVKGSNMSAFRRIMQKDEKLDTVSMLEKDVNDDLKDFKDAIINGTLSDEYNITEKQLASISDVNTENIVSELLDLLISDTGIIPLSELSGANQNNLKVYELFQKIYENYLGRQLVDGEKSVINTGIKILLWQIHCKTFKDICFYRYSYVSRRQEREHWTKRIAEGNAFECKLAELRLSHLMAAFVTPYSEIPNKELRVFPMFDDKTKAVDVDYDRIVFDTYDYLDKLIGFRLSDVFYAAFDKHYEKTMDECALTVAKLIKYGTESSRHIWLLRYGFSFEDIEWLDDYVVSVSQEEIVFKDSVKDLSKERYDLVKRFI